MCPNSGSSRCSRISCYLEFKAKARRAAHEICDPSEFPIGFLDNTFATTFWTPDRCSHSMLNSDILSAHLIIRLDKFFPFVSLLSPRDLLLPSPEEILNKSSKLILCPYHRQTFAFCNCVVSFGLVQGSRRECNRLEGSQTEAEVAQAIGVSRSVSSRTWNRFWRLEVQAEDQDKVVDGQQRPMKIVI
ncbi:hypothetical protein TNCV_880301 [Trichonephila clavipes]|nr:hypothetical protein TNCV_880301 [Trichonephila clavipes]